MTILVTGAAGFIGYHVSEALLKEGRTVIGIDNMNDYYDVKLKRTRLRLLKKNKNFTFHKADICNRKKMEKIASKVDEVIHLAAQAGVRYSIENPEAYIKANLIGHFTLVDVCSKLPIKHFVYASSSSVYGNKGAVPFGTYHPADHPQSLYAATKRSGELMSYAYSQLTPMPQTGLRFFTVYGPWGRPDMAYFTFTRDIIAGTPIQVFNRGKMKRDFTYIDDIVQGVLSALKTVPKQHEIYNLGNSKTEELMHFIKVIENSVGKKAVLDYQPMQPGDVKETYAEIIASRRDLDFNPTTTIEEGIPKFVEWYKEYYRV